MLKRLLMLVIKGLAVSVGSFFRRSKLQKTILCMLSAGNDSRNTLL